MPQIVKKKRASSKLSKYRIYTFIVVVFLATGIGAFWPAYVWSSQMDKDVEKLVSEKNRLAQQNQELKEEVRRLNTSEYLEQLARQDLGLVKPGEVPITQTAPSKR